MTFRTEADQLQDSVDQLTNDFNVLSEHYKTFVEKLGHVQANDPIALSKINRSELDKSQVEFGKITSQFNTYMATLSE